MTEDRQATLVVMASPSSSSAGAVRGTVPASFEISGDVVDFGVEPWRALAYAYSARPAARVNVSALPEAMRRELAWWLHSLNVGGERVNSHVLASWVKVPNAVSADPGRQVRSFVDLSVAEWMAAARASFYGRHGRLPGVTFEQNYRATIARLHAAVARCYDTGEWWRADHWDPRRDPRIPLREHEALGNSRLNFERVTQPWLAEAIKWYFALSLETGNLVWSSLPSALTSLGTHLSEFLVASGIDTPALVADPEAELRAVAMAFLGNLRQRRSLRGQPLSTTSVGLIQSGVSSFYAFMADHRVEAARALGEPRWAELSDAHARLWRSGEYLRRDRHRSGGDYIDPAALSRIVEHLDILSLAKDQTKTVVVDGVRKEIAGMGDPQAMRAFLLEVFTGRRINEILLADFEPLSPVPGLDPDQPRGEGAFVARFRYRQSKIAGAPDTILVEAEVVNIIAEQQAWLVDHLAAANPGTPTPRYLFVAWQSNRRGHQPYSANTLRGLLATLVGELQIRDAQGCLVDFQRTHRMRHSKATELLNSGVPLHVVQRYMGHLSPEMTMHYAATLAKTHEAEFLRFKKLGRDGRDVALEPSDVYELVQLGRHTDRILPNGACLLPPLKRCDRGNACLTCDHFATDGRYLDELETQLSETEGLIARRQAQHRDRTGQEMGEGNVWLDQRLAERRSLTAIVAALQADGANGHALRGAGVPGRVGQPVELDTDRHRRRESQ
ncbi:MAG: tyrosine-type recombinase/integrase [Actinomycetota bacterium]|nr:tyrosine-type recombinase/integrase [Actinomycetota bacterium]